MSRRKRCFLYSQHLSGTGHFVRTYEIACALAEEYEVYLSDGGRPVPRPRAIASLKLITLPRIYRSTAGIIPLDSRESIEEIREQRKRSLLQATKQICPDVILVEHFPFSKWELYAEIIPLIQLAQIVNQRVKVFCSLRDIPGRMRHDSKGEQHHLQVIQTLHQYFDGILVHADPQVVRLQEHLSWVEQITIPIEYTGYVSQKAAPHSVDEKFPHSHPSETAIVSAGGAGSLSLISNCIEAWEHPSIQNFTRDRQLLIFLPLFFSEDKLTSLQNYLNSDRIQIQHFSANFLNYLQTATLSISQAGYNTCTNILETRTPAILIPNPAMSDQLPRSRILAERGLVTAIEPEYLSPTTLARAIIETISQPIITHKIDLNGSQNTRQILRKILDK
ncbi:MAG: glycosyltransferase [Oscillatoria sp. PMC 1051.18]|nr:glycosyltransferase [Oscillatoria sp. PMC 1050.18]MEC5032239.1 glycosyltransferase [Oscillatoria sp. PMC 1051.18]